ncbi:transmembrane protein 276-like [Glandiceps talaboti]
MDSNAHKFTSEEGHTADEQSTRSDSDVDKKLSERQLSVAISDFALAVTSLNAAFVILSVTKLGSFGFLLIGTAASCGVVRFASSSPPQHLIGLHAMFSWLAGTVGLSCIASALYRSHGQYMVSSAHLAASLALTAVTRILAPEVQDVASQAVSGAAVISILMFSLFKFNPYGLVGASMYVLSGIVGTKGLLLGIKCVDWFHYILAFANVALMKALQKYEPLVFYRPKT